MKDRSDRDRSYNGELMGIGEPAEAYVARYLEREYGYVRVVSVGKEKRRRDFRCFLPDGKVHLNECKTDTKIADTSKIPWEIFRLEKRGARAYISWGYASPCYRVVFYVPQWLRLLDARAEDVRRVIFEHFMAKGRQILVAPTLTDKDRITFNFLVPLGLLKQKDVLKEVEIAEIPLGPPVPYQARLNGERKDTAIELERLQTYWKQVIEQAPGDTKRTTVAAILRSPGTRPVAIEGNTITLAFNYPFHKEHLERAENKKTAERIISTLLGHPCHVRCVLETEHGHLAKAAQEPGAEIINDKQ